MIPKKSDEEKESNYSGEDVLREFEIFCSAAKMPTNGHNYELTHLMRKMKSIGVRKNAKVTEERPQPRPNKFDRIIKKLECSVNYNNEQGW